MKKIMKDSARYVTGGVLLGTGASVATSIGGTAGASAAKGMSNAASMMPVMGTLSGAGGALRALKKLK